MDKTKKNSSLEEDVLLLQEKGKNTSISIGEILNILSEKSHPLIILFLSLPFCQPLQIPGLSTPFGIAIVFIGLKMACGKYVWLPKKILGKPITPQILQKITEKTLWFLKKMNRWVYPRLACFYCYPISQIINGLLISVLGILLALPLPTPFSNLMAAWSILFIALGLLKDDGVCILIGYFVSLFTFGYFVLIILLIKHII